MVVQNLTNLFGQHINLGRFISIVGEFWPPDRLIIYKKISVNNKSLKTFIKYNKTLDYINDIN